MEEKKITQRPVEILIVDDNLVDAKILQNSLTKTRYKNNVYMLNDGEKALDFIYARNEFADRKKLPHPDLILLDIKLPGIGGIEILKELKEHTQYCEIPVIMVTNYNDEETIEKCYQYGCAGYFHKPIKFDIFIRVIDGFLFIGMI